MFWKSGRKVAYLAAMLVLAVFCVSEVAAQKKRTKKSRRATNPVTRTAVTTPTPSTLSSDPSIVSTADDNTSETAVANNGRRNSSRRQTPAEEETTQRHVERLSAQVSALNEKLSLMEQQQRTLVDLERLTRAESRAEALRAQLRDVQAKEADLQSRLEQLDYELQPSVIERTLAMTGSTKPEDLRELRRRQLEAEKSRAQSQVSLVTTSRVRLETAIANADAEAERLRARVEAATEPQAAEANNADLNAPIFIPTQPTDTGDGEPEM